MSHPSLGVSHLRVIALASVASVTAACQPLIRSVKGIPRLRAVPVSASARSQPQSAEVNPCRKTSRWHEAGVGAVAGGIGGWAGYTLLRNVFAVFDNPRDRSQKRRLILYSAPLGAAIDAVQVPPRCPERQDSLPTDTASHRRYARSSGHRGVRLFASPLEQVTSR
jgi:hypothetical protein